MGWCMVVYGGVWGGVWWCTVVYGGVWWCMSELALQIKIYRTSHAYFRCCGLYFAMQLLFWLINKLG